MYRKTFLFLLLFAVFIPVLAQDSAEMALVRFAHLAADAPNVDVFVNGEAAVEAFGVGWASPFMEREPGTLSVAIAPTGEGIDAAVIGPLDIDVEAGSRYTVVVVGQAADNSLATIVINETEAMEGVDLSGGAFHIFVNNIVGAPALTWNVGSAAVENIGYGEVGTTFAPTGNWNLWQAVSADDPETVLLDMCCEEGGFGFWEPNLVYLWGMMGTYPGAPFEAYNFSDAHYSPVNIIDYLAGYSGLGLSYGGDDFVDYEFDTLLAAIEAAGLTETLAMEGPYTLFAPTDDAFASLPEGTLDALMADSDALRDLLMYHVVDGAMSYDDLVTAGSVTTMQGSDIAIVPNPDGGIPVPGLLANDETLIGWIEYPVTNGSVYFIDNFTPLMPPSS